MEKELTPVQRDLQLHHETILRWIKSVRKEPQLTVCSEAIEELVKKRFAPFIESKQLEVIEVATVYSDLEEALADQSKTITQNGERSNYLMNGIDDIP